MGACDLEGEVGAIGPGGVGDEVDPAGGEVAGVVEGGVWGVLCGADGDVGCGCGGGDVGIQRGGGSFAFICIGWPEGCGGDGGGVVVLSGVYVGGVWGEAF